MTERRTEILVVGGGPAGLAAAEAASSRGKKVTVIDDNPTFGGQIWRAEKSALNENAKRLVDSLETNKVEMLASCSCIAALPRKRILTLSSGQPLSIAYDKAVIATGARERFVPFPGWTLPGVFGAGGLQALVKGGFDVSGKRIVVAGTGPLLLAVAAYLKKKGGNVLFIAEQAGLADVLRVGLVSLVTPGKISQANALRKELRGIPYRNSALVTGAHGSDSLGSVTVRRRGRESRVDCDLLAVGHHLAPNTEVAELLGCGVANGRVIVHENQQTTVKDIFCAGEPGGIGGLELSLIEGKIAGLAATGRIGESDGHSKEMEKHRRFASVVNSAFRVEASDLRAIQTDDTIVCRCEDVSFGEIKDLEGFNKAKLQTRLGMGFCQGRVCGSACEALFEWEGNPVRPPLVPVKVGNLANFETENN